MSTTTTATATATATQCKQGKKQGNKRALIATANANAIDLGAFPKYEVVCGSPSVAKPQQRALRLFSEGGDCLEFGSVNPKSGVMFARYNDDKLYVGYNHHNPGSYSANGECIEQSTMGVSMDTLLRLFAMETLPGKFDATPREGWNAGFRVLAAPGGHVDTLCFRVHFTTPFAGTQTATFQDEFVMHAFSA